MRGTTPHWSFVAPKRPAIPQDPNMPVRNPIDAFYSRSAGEREGLKPSPEADRYTLIRRVYLDLIGIPPTPEEVDAFVNDKSPDAYEKLVDRLLASPALRRALGAAAGSTSPATPTPTATRRTASARSGPIATGSSRPSTTTCPSTSSRSSNSPATCCPNATPTQRIATGFHRNTMLNEEGGIDPLEFRFYAMIDRVATTGTVWLGLTSAAPSATRTSSTRSRTREYYRLFAFLNNADEPEMPVPTAEQTQTRGGDRGEDRCAESAKFAKAQSRRNGESCSTPGSKAQHKAAVQWTIAQAQRSWTAG